MKNLLRRCRPSVYALIFTGLLFLCLPLAQMMTDNGDKKLIVRSIDIASPPPPPPPESPDTPEDQEDQKVELQDMSEIIPLDMLNIDLNPNIAGALAVAVKAKNFNVKMNLAADFKTFDLAALDNLPRMMNHPRGEYPAKLAARGIKKSMVEILVIIHETGRLTIEKFIKCDHPELKPAARKWIKQVLFSPPKKDGKAVKGKFILPLELDNDA